MTDPGERRRRREARSRRAVAVVTAHARAQGLRVEEPAVLADLFSLMVHLRPAPVVARVSTSMPRLRSPITDWLAAEIDVTTFLSRQGAPVVAPSSELPPGPHEHDGFAFSYWTYVRPDPERTPTTADCSAMLVDLHAALRRYPGALPRFGANDIRRGLDALDGAGGMLTEPEVARLRAVADRLRPFMEAPGDVQPLHGDAHPGNLIAAREGLLWIDFEDACRGPVEWDLATMMDADAIGAHHRPDPEVLARCRDLRALQIALAMVALHDDLGDIEGWNEGIRGMLAALGDKDG
jgi:hypothetical protein